MADTAKRKAVIFVGAHPDDIELGCAGTIGVFLARGYDVRCIFVTKGGYTGSPFEREKESRAALTGLGVKNGNIVFGDFPDTRIPATVDTIKFLQDSYLTNWKGRDRAALDVYAAFVHTSHDVHQDHRAVAECCITAFRRVPRIYAYEAPSSIGAFNPTAFVDISQHLQAKQEALACHKSQLALGNRYYLEYDSMINLSRFRGRQGGFEHAEAFEVWKESIDPPELKQRGKAPRGGASGSAAPVGRSSQGRSSRSGSAQGRSSRRR